MASKNNFSVVIDIGTSKLVAIAGQRSENREIEILAFAKTPSRGIKRGIVFNVEEAANSISVLLEEIETQLNEKITQVDVAYAGQHMKMVDYKTSRFTSDDGVVSEFEIQDLYNEAKKVEVEKGYKLIKVIPNSFVVDDETTDLNPVGITGKKIEANYKLVLIPEVYLANLNRVFDRVGIEFGEVALSPLALSETVLTDDEKELGAIVLDIGAGTTKMAIYRDNMLVYTVVIPFGGDVITHDIKEGCSILIKWAEQLKVQYGQALGDKADDQKMVTIPSQNGWESKEISFKSLAFIIQARLVEILDIVSFHIEKSGIGTNLGLGIILTGGTSNLESIISLLQFETGMQVRKAYSIIHPINKRKETSNQEYFVSLGLLKQALSDTEVQPKRARTKKPGRNNSSNIIKRLKGGLQIALELFEDENEDIAMN